jgi:hypothetical protein
MIDFLNLWQTRSTCSSIDQDSRHRRSYRFGTVALVLAVGATSAAGETPEFDYRFGVPDDQQHPRCLWEAPPAGEGLELTNTVAATPVSLARGSGTVHRIVCRFHIVRRADGTGGFDEALIPKMMEDLNVGFRDTPFAFVRDPGVVYVDNDTYYADFPTFQGAFNMLNANFESGVMSWYITPSVRNGGVAGTWIGPASPVRGILMAYFATGNPQHVPLAAHEMAHIFQVLHPFEPAFGTECADGSNCTSAGDLVCDTPASPQLHGGNTTGTGIYYGGGNGPAPVIRPSRPTRACT